MRKHISEMPRFLMVVLALCLVVTGGASSSFAAQETAVEWKNLLPELPPLKDPTTVLTGDQQLDLETIIWARGISAEERQLEHNQPALQDAVKYEKQFKDAGIDLDKLLEKYQAWQREIARRQELVNEKLNSKSIKIAGYLLPIEFSEKGQTDFLLVPYVGACVHVPPPPPNQIVFVKLAEKMVVKDLYTPVWVKGVIKTQLSSQMLNLADGNRKIPIGYVMADAAFETYKEK